MGDIFEEKAVTIVHRGGSRRAATFLGFARNIGSTVSLNTGYGSGGVFALSHGWGSSPLTDWRIDDVDLDRLREWAMAQGRKVPYALPPKRRGRKSNPSTVAKPVVDPRQMPLDEVLDGPHEGGWIR